MKPSKDRKWGLFGLLAAICAVYLLMDITKPKEIVPFGSDFPAAKKEAAGTGKPIFLDFTAAWCGPCQSLKTTTFADKRVAAALDKYVTVSIDIDQQVDLAREYHVDSIPAFFVVDARTGNILKENRQGALLPDEFLAWLKG